MPLVSDRQSKPLSHSNSRAIGFWMRASVSWSVTMPYRSSIRRTSGICTALWRIFDRFRSQVETAASRKFDRYGFDAQNYEGMPAIRLTTVDLI